MGTTRSLAELDVLAVPVPSGLGIKKRSAGKTWREVMAAVERR